MRHKELKNKAIADDLVRAFALSRIDIRISSALPTSRITSAGARSAPRIAMNHQGDH
jgi:hypothetical protein